MKQQVIDLKNQVKEYAFKQDRLEQNFNKIQEENLKLRTDIKILQNEHTELLH